MPENEIETLVNEEKPAGPYELTWNAANLPGGVYFYQLRAGDFIQTKKDDFVEVIEIAPEIQSEISVPNEYEVDLSP